MAIYTLRMACASGKIIFTICRLSFTIACTNTKMLRMVLGVTWKDKVSNAVLYDKLPRLSDKIKSRRLKLAGH